MLSAARAVHAPAESDEAVRLLLAAAIDMLDADAGSVLVLDGRVLRAVAASGGDCAVDEVFEVGRGVMGRVVATAEPLRVDGALLGDGHGWFGPAPHGALTVPLCWGETVIGILAITGSPVHELDDDDLVALQVVAAHVSSVLVRPKTTLADAESTIVVSNGNDAITGLASREVFADRVNRSLRRGGGSGLAVILVNLDDFKRVNDSWSYAAGDELLRAVAFRLDGAIRDSDTVSRLTGAEFAVLVEGVTRVADDKGAHGTLVDVRADVPAETMTAAGAVDLTFADGTTLDATGMRYAGDGIWQFTDVTVVLPAIPGGAAPLPSATPAPEQQP